MKFRSLLAVLLLSVGAACTADASTPVYGYKVVARFPHATDAFTEGLVYLDGWLYESTGLEGHSFLRKVDLATGRPAQQFDLPPRLFGEGMVNWKDKLITLTWRSEIGFVFDRATLAPEKTWTYPGEGWALTQDGKRLIMSDGTAQLRFLDPDTLQETGRITVTDEGRPVPMLNELEYVKGEVYANIWQTDRIVRIDPASGKVTGWIDLTGILPPAERGPQTDVLNGIAYDAAKDRLFVTGKNWPTLFQIELTRK